MAQPVNAAPKFSTPGFSDQSTVAQTASPLQVPTHLPLCYLYTAWGADNKAALVTPQSLVSNFGADSLDPRSPYFTTQTLYADTCLKQGNIVMAYRLKPQDAGPKARLLFSLDIVADNVQQYVRNADGTFERDAQGNLQPITGAGATLAGNRAKWVINQWLPGDPNVPDNPPELFGEVGQRAGSLVSAAGKQSVLVPMFELEVPFFGARGNLTGARFMAPTTTSATLPLDGAQAARVKSFIYRMQLLTRPSATQTPSVVATRQGAQWQDFTFSPGAYDVNKDQNLDFETALRTGYTARVPRTPEVFGPFQRLHVYQANVDAMLAQIGATEAPHGLLPTNAITPTSDQLYSVNPLTAVNYDGVPYYTLALVQPADGGSIFTPASTYYGAGASDGTMTAQSYDNDVAAAVAGFNMLDIPAYPFSTVYDSGYSLATKKAIIGLLGQRPDIWLSLSTQSVLDAQNTPDQDASMGRALAAAVGNFPESVLNGTQACRAEIVEGSGRLLNAVSSYTKIVPLNLQHCKRYAAYMGAANAVWDSTVPPDENPQNILDMFDLTNVVYKSDTARTEAWSNGVGWAETFDIDSLYFPAMPSVYGNDTSILKAMLNVIIACDLIKVAHTVYSMMVGNSRLTDDQFASRSDELFRQLIKGRYAGRVQVRPKTFYTQLDAANGYSWSVNIDLYGNVMKTVAEATVIARRLNTLPINT